MLQMGFGSTSVSEIGTCILGVLIASLDVKTSVQPVPHTAVNRTHGAWQGYQVMMFIFGFAWGWVNAFVAWAYFTATFEACDRGQTDYPLREKRYIRHSALFALILFQLFVAVPAAIFLILMPFFGAWIVTPIVKHVSALHLLSIAC